MTVKDLISLLSLYPDDLPVLIRGYELGFDGVSSAKVDKVMENPTDHEWEGNFVTMEQRDRQTRPDWLGDTIPLKDSEKPVECLILVGDSR